MGIQREMLPNLMNRFRLLAMCLDRLGSDYDCRIVPLEIGKDVDLDG